MTRKEWNSVQKCTDCAGMGYTLDEYDGELEEFLEEEKCCGEGEPLAEIAACVPGGEDAMSVTLQLVSICKTCDGYGVIHTV